VRDLLEREVAFGNGETALVSLNEPVARFSENPILTAREVNRAWRDPALRVVTVHNAGVACLGAETIMLFRSHLRCGMSVLGLARCENGVNGWRVAPAPVLRPASREDAFAPGVDIEALIEQESGGVEDPRIMCMGDSFAVTYSAYHGHIKNRVKVCLAATPDFRRFVRYGPVSETDMRNVVFFPEPIHGAYWGLFRPNDIIAGDIGGAFTRILIGVSGDWQANRWEMHPRPVMQTGGGPGAFSDKIGPGAPPLRTPYGWLSLFHGVRATMDGNPYVLGVALHDLNNPASVRVCAIPVLFPTAADCRVDEDEYVHVPNVVFTCGALARENGVIHVYYGGNDTVMNIGVTHQDILAALCERYPLAGR
jgi:predicted GH43/DUF377 family glycosyl hydrolase